MEDKVGHKLRRTDPNFKHLMPMSNMQDKFHPNNSHAESVPHFS